jgi:hypothetical protein
MLNSILCEAGLKLRDVRLIRHKDKRSKKGCSPYELWCNDRPKFEWYQRTQRIKSRKILTAPYWAVFVVNPRNETMFVGIYAVDYHGLLDHDSPMPNMDGIDKAGSCDVFDLELQDTLSDLIGNLFIDWGQGFIAWVQYAEQNNKRITKNVL